MATPLSGYQSVSMICLNVQGYLLGKLSYKKGGLTPPFIKC